MKTITEIIGGAQSLLPLDYDIQDSFFNFVTIEQKTFIQNLRIIEEYLPALFNQHFQKTGRPYLDDLPFFRAFLAKGFFRTPTTKDLISRLMSDTNLKQICGFLNNDGLSEATFSRRFALFAELEIFNILHENIVKSELQDIIIGHINRDSTAIGARETPMNKKADVKPLPKKRGRPKKGEIREKEETRLEKQINQTPEESLNEINQDCAWGCKKNSQGKVSYWKGYKLHLDVNDFGLPITAITTGANVHDSQLAIPMEKISSDRVTHLYSLMDAAYDAEPIHNFIKSNDNIPIIDPKKKRNGIKIELDKAKKIRFRNRSTVERANAHLKDWLFSGTIFVKGYSKVNAHLMIGVLLLTSIKILQYIKLPEAVSNVA